MATTKSAVPAQRKAATKATAPAVVPGAPEPMAIKDRKVQAAIRELRELEERKKADAARGKVLELLVKQYLGAAEEGTIGGVRVVTWKETIRTTLSATLVKKAYPEIARECTVDSLVRTFKLLAPEA